jgi:hypothetical protein
MESVDRGESDIFILYIYYIYILYIYVYFNIYMYIYMYIYTWGRDRLRTVLAGMIAVQSGANYQKTE